jgi:hypothetical protein
VRSIKFNRSTGFQHARETIHLWRHFAQQFQVPGALGKAKPIWIINIDSGPDKHPTHYASIIANAILFVRCDLQLLVLLSLAAGFSSINEHEQSQGAVTNVTAGTVYPSDQYGTVKRNQHGQPVTDADAELEKRNHAYAVEKCRKMLDGKNGARAWGRPMHAFTGSKSESIDDEAILKYRDQSGGCSCKGDCSTKRCGKCHAKNVPCTFRCACKGKCKNPSPTPELQGVTAAERA